MSLLAASYYVLATAPSVSADISVATSVSHAKYAWASWNYSDAENDVQNGSVYTWFVNGQEAWKDSSLVGYWRLDSDTLDSSNYGNNGTIEGTLTNLSSGGIVKGAFQFDDDVITVADSGSLNFSTGDFTFSAWVRMSSLLDANNFYAVLSKTDSTNGILFYGSNGENGGARCSIADGLGGFYTVDGSNIRNNAFHHIACTRRNGTIYLYVDGVLLGSISANINFNSPVQLEIGRASDGQSENFNGTIDEVKAWNRSLTAAEIMHEYQLMKYGQTEKNWNSTLTGSPAHDIPALLYHFDENTGNITKDYFGNTTGILTGGVNWTNGLFGSNALIFNSTLGTQFVNVSFSQKMNITRAITIEAWVKPINYNPSRGYIISKSIDNNADSWSVSITATGKLSFVLSNETDSSGADIQSVTTLNNYTWYHVAAVWDGATQSLYINGSLDADGFEKQGTINITDSNLIIGNSWQLSNEFNGTIEEVAIYSRALSESEINQSYKRGFPHFGYNTSSLGSFNLSALIEPSDGTEFGTASMTANVTYTNANPSADSIGLAPGTVYKNTSFNASVVAIDNDTDTMRVTFRWYNNSVNIVNNTIAGVTNGTNVTNTISNSLYNHFGNISVEIQIEDVTANATFVNSSTVQISNTAPFTAVPSLSPSNPGAQTTINASVVISDNDTDSLTVTFRWYVNNNSIYNTTALSQSDGTTTAILNPSNFTTNDNISVEVYADDSYGNSTFQNSSYVTVLSTSLSSCRTINEPGSYVLIQNIANSGAARCINITASNVVLNGQGYNIDGTDVISTHGIYVYNSSLTVTNVTIKNFNMTDWFYGITLQLSDNNTLLNNTVFSNYQSGIYLTTSHGNNLTNNTAKSSGQSGIYIETSENNTLLGNVANSNQIGIHIRPSSNFNTVINNTASSNSDTGIIIQQGSAYNSIINNTLSSNSYSVIIIDGSNFNTVQKNIANSNSDIGIKIVDSLNNNVINNTVRLNTNQGIWLESSNNTLIENNTASSNGMGIGLSINSTNNTLINNTASSNSNRGIVLAESSNNSIINNTVNSNSNEGIVLETSNNNIVVNNTASSNGGIGIIISINSTNNTAQNNIANLNNNNGIVIANSANNTAQSNTVNSNTNTGIILSFANNATVSFNNINNNSAGILVESSRSSSFLNNNITNSTSIDINIDAVQSVLSENNTFTNTFVSNLTRSMTGNTFVNTTFGYEYPIKLSFSNQGNVTLNRVLTPESDTTNYLNISKYIIIENLSLEWILLNMSYTDIDAENVTENGLRFVMFGSSWATPVTSSFGTDTANNYVYANITYVPGSSLFSAQAFEAPTTLMVNVSPGSNISLVKHAWASWNYSDTNNDRQNGSVYTWFINGSEAWKDPSLVGYWRLDGNALDSANNNHGTIQNGAVNLSKGGIIKGAYSFDGINDHINISSTSQLNIISNISISAWFKAVTGGTIAAKPATDTSSQDTPYSLGINDSGFVIFNISNSTQTFHSQYQTTMNKWHNAIGTYNGSVMSLYIDGVLVNYTTASGQINTSTRPFFIGGVAIPPLGVLFTLEGDIDEVKLWNRSLSSIEIMHEYQLMKYGQTEKNWNSTLTGSPAHDIPALLYHFDENTGNITKDYFGNTTGILTGGVNWTNGLFGSNALIFNDTLGARSASVSFSQNMNTSGAFTIETWIKSDGFSGGINTIANKDIDGLANSWLIYVTGGSNNLAFGLTNQTDTSNTDIQGTTNIQTNVWYHVAATWNGTTKSIYVNGSLEASGEKMGFMNITNSSLIIGSGFNGTIEEFAIYNRALSESEINQSYLRGFPHFGYNTSLLSEITNLSVLIEPSDGTYFGDSLMSSNASIASSSISVSSCRTINAPGTYILNQSISNSGALSCINITVSNVVLDGAGYTIDGNDTANTNGINVTGINVTVKNAILTDWGFGIYLLSSANNTILNNTATSNSDGMILASSSNNLIVNNTFNSNSQYGVRLFGSALNNLTNNAISSNSGTGLLIESGNNIVINNTINSNFQGMYIDTSNSLIIENNTANSNQVNGIRLLSSNFNKIDNNILNSNAVNGLFSTASTYNNISENTMNLNQENGISLSTTSTNNNITFNTMNSNTLYGIYLLSSSSNIVMDNNASSNNMGVRVESSNFNIIDNNTASSNSNHGILLSGSNNNNLTNNTVRSNNNEGIYLISSSANNYIGRNIASSNTFDGIILDSSDSNTIFNNTLNMNGRYGLYLTVSNSADVSYNTITNNTDTDIYIDSGTNNTFTNNFISNRTRSMTGNTFINTTFGYDYQTKISFTHEGNITLNRVLLPPTDPVNYQNISKYINVTNSSLAWINLTIHYTDIDAENISESHLNLKSFASSWSDLSSSVNTAGNYIYSNITFVGSSAIIAPFSLQSITNCTVISSSGGYALENNINTNADSCINITASNVVLDGGNFNLNGTDSVGYGINATNVNNITIKNFNVTNWNYGIYLYNSNNNSIFNSTFGSNSFGVRLNSTYTVISNNTVVSASQTCIYLDTGSAYNNITNNNLSNSNSRCIELDASNNNLINNNVLAGSIDSIFLSSSSSNQIINNTVSSASGSGIHVQNSNSNSIENNTLNSNTANGVYLLSHNSGIFDGNKLSGNGAGLRLENSDFNTIENNNASANTNGIVISGSSDYNNLTNNTANSNTNMGFNFSRSGTYVNGPNTNNLIQNSSININSYGIYSDSSNENSVLNNHIANNTNTDVFMLNSTNNTFTNNFVSNNTRSVTGNTFINITFGYNYPIKISFTHEGNVTLNRVLLPPANPTGYQNISKYINVTNQSLVWILLNVSYTDTDVENVTESSLALQIFNSSWNTINISGINIENNYVYSNITFIDSSAIVAPLAQSNLNPIVTTPMLTPSTAYESSIINASTTPTDNESTLINVTFKWIKNGINILNSTVLNQNNNSASTAILTNGNYSHFDNISVCVYANNGRNTSSTSCAANVTVQNSAPLSASVGLIPPTAYRTSSFNASVVAIDNDTDTMRVTFRWYNNTVNMINNTIAGVANGTNVTNTISTLFSHFDNVSVEIQIEDAWTNTTFVNSSTVQISNSAPLAANTALTPTTANKFTSFNASVIALDNDTDAMQVTFRWYKNNLSIVNTTISSITNGTNITNTIGNGNYSRYDNISVEIKIEDTYTNGTWINSSVVQITNLITSCTTINVADSYLLNQDIINSTAGVCINITSPNVILDGAGYTIDGIGLSLTSRYGINLTGSNSTVKNLILTHWGNGINLYSNNSLINNITANYNNYAILVDKTSSFNTISNSTFSSNGNLSTSDGGDIYLNGGFVTNNIVTNITSEYSLIGVLINGNRNNLTFSSINSSFEGIEIDGSNASVQNNSLNNNTYGIQIFSSSNNFFYNNIANSSIADIKITSGTNNLFENNFVSNSTVSITGNTFANQTFGYDYPVTLRFTHEGTVTLNRVLSPPANPSGYQNISKYINITNSSLVWILLNFTYSEYDLDNVNESALIIMMNNGTWLNSTFNINGTDANANNIFANITYLNGSAIFGPLSFASPTIINVSNTSITTSSAIVSFATDINSNYTLSYGASLAMGSYSSNSSLNTTRNITLSSLSSGTTHYYNITACSQGSCQTVGPFSFTTTSVASSTPSSGSGGGGGAAPAKETQTVSGSTGTNITLNFTKSSVDSIQITLANSTSGVTVSVKDTTWLQNEPGGTVYQYVDISKSKEFLIQNAKVRFTVNKTWIDDKKINKYAVRLERLVAGVWTKLNTIYISEDSKEITYEAETPGFSVFAIVGDPIAVVEYNETMPCVAKIVEKSCNYNNETKSFELSGSVSWSGGDYSRLFLGTNMGLQHNLSLYKRTVETNDGTKTLIAYVYDNNDNILCSDTATVACVKEEIIVIEKKKEDYSLFIIAAVIIIAGGAVLVVLKKKRFEASKFKLQHFKLPKLKEHKKEHVEKKKFRLPKITLPKIKMPEFKLKKKEHEENKFKLPEFKLPELETHEKEHLKKREFKLPKIKLPELKIRLPKITLPKIKLHKEEKQAETSKHKIKLPKIKLPKLKLPKFKLLEKKKEELKPIEISKHKFKLSELKKIEFKLPKIKLPKITLPKLKLPKLEMKKVHTELKQESELKIPKIEVQEIEYIEETKPIIRAIPNMIEPIKFLKSKSLAVDEISIIPNKEVNYFFVTVKEIPEPFHKPSGIVYKYIQMSKSDIKDDDISDVRVKFYVPKAWIKENSIDIEKIKLIKLETGDWKKIDTKFFSSDMDSVTYESKSVWFGTFAIVGQK